MESKISSFITIQEGCDKFCNFCVVPYTRGPEYSRSPEEIIKETKDLISNGAKEIILLDRMLMLILLLIIKKNFKLSDLILELESLKD